MSIISCAVSSRLLDERADRHDPGVVDQHVDRAELLLGRVEEARERLAVGDVELEGDGLAAQLRRRSARRAPGRGRRSRPARRGGSAPSPSHLPIPRAPPVIATTFPATDLTCLRAIACLSSVRPVESARSGLMRGPLDAASSTAAARAASASLGARHAASRAQQVLVGIVGVAAERAEPVDRERHVGSDVARVAGAAARASPAIGRPSSSAARASGAAAISRASSPGQSRRTLGPQGDAVELGGNRRDDRLEARLGVGAHVDDAARPSPGTALIASPGAHHRRHDAERLGAGRVVHGGERPARRRRGRAGRCGPRRGWRRSGRRRPRASTRIAAAALRLTTTASVPSASRSPPSKQRQASKPREARAVDEGRGPELLVVDEQQRDLGEAAGALGERPQHAERERVAALHVDRARAEQAVAVDRRRAMALVGDDGVEVADEQQARRAACPRTRASRSGAWSGEEHSIRSTSAPSGSIAVGDRDRALGGLRVAGGARDRRPARPSRRARARRSRPRAPRASRCRARSAPIGGGTYRR